MSDFRVTETLSALLREPRHKERWPEIAEKVGVKEVTLRQYANPKNPLQPSLEKLAALAVVLGVSTDYLIFGAAGQVQRDKRRDLARDSHLFRSMLELQSYQEQQGVMFGRISQALARRIEAAVTVAAKEAVVPDVVYSGLISNEEAARLELHSRETLICALNLEEDLETLGDDAQPAEAGASPDGVLHMWKSRRAAQEGGFVSGSFLPIVASNLQKNRRYRFLLSAGGAKDPGQQAGTVARYRAQVGQYCSTPPSKDNLQFRSALWPLVTGMVVMNVDATALERDGVLFQRVADYLPEDPSGDKWLGYSIPPNRHPICGLLMDSFHVENARDAFERYWEKGRPLDEAARRAPRAGRAA